MSFAGPFLAVDWGTTNRRIYLIEDGDGWAVLDTGLGDAATQDVWKNFLANHIDRPLTRLKDFANWIGQEARIHLTAPVDGRKQLTGDLAGVDGDRITIDVKKHQPMTIGFDQVADAKLLITDKLIAATAPLSSDGAEEFETEESN